jgi:hypothetical protein
MKAKVIAKLVVHQESVRLLTCHQRPGARQTGAGTAYPRGTVVPPLCASCSLNRPQ